MTISQEMTPQPKHAPEHPGNISTDNSSSLGLSRSDQFFLISVSTLIFILLCIHTWRLTRPGEEMIEVDRLSTQAYVFQIDINHATWVEWMQLDGVGEAMGRRIVDDRNAAGPFRSINDVQRVKGIGEITLEKMRPHLKCSDCEQN